MFFLWKFPIIGLLKYIVFTYFSRKRLKLTSETRKSIKICNLHQNPRDAQEFKMKIVEIRSLFIILLTKFLKNDLGLCTRMLIFTF